MGLKGRAFLYKLYCICLTLSESRRLWYTLRREESCRYDYMQGDGDRQRHAGLLFGRRKVQFAGGGDTAREEPCCGGRGDNRHRRRVDAPGKLCHEYIDEIIDACKKEQKK